ncbi:tRNA-Phe hydroxylase [Aureococcus anophagefferens]|nr:tRNA-Phe hydroxylase [Aureococcus anophagefferens]
MRAEGALNPALERAAAAALGAIAETPALGDDLAAIVEPFARAQCGRVPANAADGARRVRSVAAALAALAEGGGASALLEPLLEAYVPRLRRSAARFDGGLLAADAVARSPPGRAAVPGAAWLAADGGALDAVAEGVARAIEHLFEDGASPELHYATPPPAPGGGAYVVAADEAVVFASPRGVAAGALPRHKRVTATAWDGPDWARVEAPVAGWVFASSATARAPLAAALAERRRADAAGEAAAFYAAKIPLADHLPELDDDARATRSTCPRAGGARRAGPSVILNFWRDLHPAKTRDAEDDDGG